MLTLKTNNDDDDDNIVVVLLEGRLSVRQHVVAFNKEQWCSVKQRIN